MFLGTIFGKIIMYFFISVLDGKQRLTTMFDFVNNKFGLRNIKYQAYRGINIFSELNTNTLKIIDNADYRDSEHEVSEKDLFDA